jgi:hypothetical protein
MRGPNFDQQLAKAKNPLQLLNSSQTSLSIHTSITLYKEFPRIQLADSLTVVLNGID